MPPAKKQDLSARAAVLEAEIDELQKTLGLPSQDEDAEKIVGKHIKLLHSYNEAKDATQILMGKLASIRQTTVRQLHENYGLTHED